MLNLIVDVLDTEDRCVEATARAVGLANSQVEDKSVETSSYYTEGHTVEEIVSDISMDLALEFFERYGQRCEVTYIRIEEA